MIFMHYVYEHKLLENKTGQAENKILEKTQEKWWNAEHMLTMPDGRDGYWRAPLQKAVSTPPSGGQCVPYHYCSVLTLLQGQVSELGKVTLLPAVT